MSIFKSISSDKLAILSASIASGFAKVLTVSDLNLFGNFLVAIGSIMLTIAAQEEAQAKLQETEKENDASNPPPVIPK